MSKEATIKKANKNEIISLSKLSEKVFKKSFSQEELEWRYLQHPYLNDRPTRNFIAKIDQQIIGHSASIPVILQNSSKCLIKATNSVGSMVLKEHGGLFPRLLKANIESAIDDGCDLIYAFPNEKSFPFFVKLFGFTQGLFSYLSISENVLADIKKTNIIVDITNKISNRNRSDYKKWRYESFQKCKSVESENLRVYFKKNKQNEYDILSIESTNNSTIFLEELVSIMKQINNVKQFNYLTTDREMDLSLQSIGFKKINLNHAFVYLWLKKTFREDQLFLQMAENDW